MYHWMFNCKKISLLVSESLDRELPLHQRIGIRIHLLMCKLCTRYKKQLLILREAARLHNKHYHDIDPDVTLPPEARERMKRSLSFNSDKSE